MTPARQENRRSPEHTFAWWVSGLLRRARGVVAQRFRVATVEPRQDQQPDGVEERPHARQTDVKRRRHLERARDLDDRVERLGSGARVELRDRFAVDTLRGVRGVAIRDPERRERRADGDAFR